MFGSTPPDPTGMRKFAGEVQRAMRTIEHWEGKRRKNEILDDLGKLTAHQYEQASRYANVIMAAGYAAFFVAWKSLGPGGTPRLHTAACLLALVSALAFLAWEVYKMTSAGYLFHRIVPLLSHSSPHEVAGVVERIKGVGRTHTLWTARLWPIALVMTIVPGFAAGLILMGMLVHRLFTPP